MDYQADIAELLLRLQPQSVLCLGERCPGLLKLYQQREPSCRITSLSTSEWPRLTTMGRFDLALITDGLEDLDKDSAAHLLARLRDLHGGRFALLLNLTTRQEQPAQWQEGELLAFGLRLLQDYSTASERLHLYFFDLYDYKVTPDWLNDRFWAHPERWDKDAW